MRATIKKATDNERTILKKHRKYAVFFGVSTYTVIEGINKYIFQSILSAEFSTSYTDEQLIFFRFMSVMLGFIVFAVYWGRFRSDYKNRETLEEVHRINRKSTDSPYFEKNDGRAKSWDNNERFYIVINDKELDIPLDLWMELDNDSVITIRKAPKRGIIFSIDKYRG
jgi:hypothetical protein